MTFEIPENIIKYIKEHNGTNLEIDYNHADADHGYAHNIFHTVALSMLTRTCHNCGYDVIWNPDDKESHCGRHSYNNWRYDEVFVWSEYQNSITLEEAFNMWLSAQLDVWYKPVVKKTFGQIGWG